MDEIEPNKVYTLTAAAKLLGSSYWYVTHAIELGHLQVHQKEGMRPRIRGRDLITFLDAPASSGAPKARARPGGRPKPTPRPKPRAPKKAS